MGATGGRQQKQQWEKKKEKKYLGFPNSAQKHLASVFSNTRNRTCLTEAGTARG